MDNQATGEAALRRGEGDLAVKYLDDLVADDDVSASEGLRGIFRAAGNFPLVNDLRLLSTERVLVALAGLESGDALPSATEEERAVVGRVAALLRRNEAEFATLMAQRTTTADSEERGVSPSAEINFSTNVEGAVLQAIARAQSRGTGPAGIVDALDFLDVFPPPGSTADKLLTRLGVGREELRQALDPGLVETMQIPTEMIGQLIGTGGRVFNRIMQETGVRSIDIRDDGLVEIVAPEQSRIDAARAAIDAVVRGGPEATASPATSAAATKKAAPRTARRSPRRYEERVFTHADEPAEIDELGRAPFAEVLARRIREARDRGGPDGPSAFIAHLHGPWGSGKSSVLNFLEAKLLEDKAGPWLIVRFNAWRNQRLQPPWWSLITRIYATARSQLGWRAALKLRLRWLFWRIRADYVPVIAVAACAVLLVLLVLWVGEPRQAVADAAGGAPPTPAEEQLANWFDRLLKLIAAAITVVGAIVLWSRSLAMGSQRAAQAYADIKNDPYRPIARLFDRLVGAIDRPVVVFVDDLDRCDGKYVVELLEGIQTLMRGAPVTYVVAGDRKWICSSFQQRYGTFSPPIGEPGRPLGYLFLDKIFQMSAAIPQPGAESQSAYWKTLLTASPGDRAVERARLAEAEAKADGEAAGLKRQEDLQKLVERAERAGDVVRIRATRAAAAKRMASQEAAVENEHRLERYRDLLEPNPRAMKRLVNAYGMHQSTLFLAGRAASPDALARWTILELRWPLLADWLANRPGQAEWLRKPLPPRDRSRVPEELHDLFGDELVASVIGPRAGRDRLSAAAIRAILGAAQGER